MDPIKIYPFGLLILCLLLYFQYSKTDYYLIRKRKKKGKYVMNEKMLKDFIGKEVMITLYGEVGSSYGVIISVDGNWIKFETKKEIKLINTDLISCITFKK